MFVKMNRIHKSFLMLLSCYSLGQPLLAQDFGDAPKPYGVLPSERQLIWHETEMYCIIHLTPTTFQDKEWGYGDADPAIFNPSKLDPRQIIGAAKAAGFKGIVLVAKHHDGFALWPTKTTPYNISKSSWKNGQGDMVKEFQLAARDLGMKFGLYCSPWDRNNPAYGSPEYLEIYRNQLKELYSNYGELFMSWHDGANGGDGYYGGKNEKRKVDQSTYYDWKNTWAITRSMQPQANIFSDIGPDARWVGNEKGFAPETSWSTITFKGKEGKVPMPGFMDDANLGNGTRNGEQWVGAECDVPLRPGWFYHANQDNMLKTPAQLFDLYCQSVGRGGDLDLGLSPDKEGLLHANDVKVLETFGQLLKQTFQQNLIKGAKLTASNIRQKNTDQYGTQQLTDANRYSYWATDDEVHQATLTIDLKGSKTFDLIRLRENIKLGQRIDSILIESKEGQQWRKVAKVTSIGANRLIRLNQPLHTAQLRLHIYAPVAITLSDLGLFLTAPELLTGSSQQSAEKILTKVAWKTIPVATSSIDNNTATVYEAQSDALVIDLGKVESFHKVGYLPRQDGVKKGIIEKYVYYTSLDGKKWTLVAQGEFSNISANPILQEVPLKEQVKARFVKLEAHQSLEIPAGEKGFSIAEFVLYP